MSVSQVKKRLSELREYLNRDKEGIKRLDLVKDEVTELRKSLAAANEATQLAVTIKDAARERADAAEAALKEAQLENQRLRNQLGSLMFDLSTVTRPVETADNRAVHKDEVSSVKSVMKALTKRTKECPQPVDDAKILEYYTLFFNRDDLSPGWTHESLWTLGASVAILTLYLGEIVINTTRALKDIGAGGEKDVMIDAWLDWFGKRNSRLVDLDMNGKRKTFGEALNSKHMELADVTRLYPPGTPEHDSAGIHRCGCERCRSLRAEALHPVRPPWPVTGSVQREDG